MPVRTGSSSEGNGARCVWCFLAMHGRRFIRCLRSATFQGLQVPLGRNDPWTVGAFRNVVSGGCGAILILQTEDESDSLVLARKPAKRRRKANGLDHKLSRMLHRANASYAAMNAYASQGKRERTTSVGSSSSTSYEVPRTPVDEVHDAVVSQRGRIGQGFKLIKLGSSDQAFEDVFTDNNLPSWNRSRKAQSDTQNDVRAHISLILNHDI